MAIFIMCLVVLKTGVLGNEKIDNPANAAAALPGSDHYGERGNFLFTLQDWRQAKIAKSRIYYNPEAVSEMSVADVKDIFGPPALERQDGNARMVQYIAGHCAADFYYTRQNSRIAHVEFRDLSGKGKSAESCRKEMLTWM